MSSTVQLYNNGYIERKKKPELYILKTPISKHKNQKQKNKQYCIYCKSNKHKKVNIKIYTVHIGNRTISGYSFVLYKSH